MLRGDLIGPTWQSDEVMEALDLCLACKACKNECPMNVDMATYKAEYVHQYYRGKLRPRAAYAMGFIFEWARLAAIAPQAANAISHAPGIGTLLQKLGGITTEREMPAFAPQTFTQWWAKRPPRNVGKPPVILWPDTFNNHFHPQTSIAAVEVLEHAGFEVLAPRQHLCCGRPLYDFGFLDTAKRKLREVMDALHDPIEAGVPVVGLEPSCVSVFRDELVELFPHDHTARSLARQTFTLGEFLSRQADDGYEPPRLDRKALVHGHCHHHSILGTNGEVDLLGRLGVDHELLDSGCCGLAGSFGYEAHKYDVSIGAGERVLAPRVREADPTTLIVADGFSCRQQIAHLTDRGALHLAQVLQMALRDGPDAPRTPFPERPYQALGRWDPTPSWAPSAVTAGAVALAGAAVGGVLSHALSQENDRR
jgi:Fe-S oxidoreductase